MATVNVLDLDLDFFLDPRPDQPAKDGRLSPTDYQPWPAARVEDFLTEQCKLRKDRPLPGDVLTQHDEVFERWTSLISSGRLPIPFSLTHVDSHADMGMGVGDISPQYIMGELLHHNPSERVNLKRGAPDGLHEGNFVSFAVARRWISSIVYVHHPQLLPQNCGLHDIPNCLFRNNDPNCGFIQQKRLPSDCQHSVQRLTEYTPLALEPEVPIQIVQAASFDAAEPFAYIFVAQSPRYTPATSDPIVDIIREFVRPIE